MSERKKLNNSISRQRAPREQTGEHRSMIRCLISAVSAHTDHAVAMDAFDLFRKLGAGAKFDLKRFGQDAARFKVKSAVIYRSKMSTNNRCVTSNYDLFTQMTGSVREQPCLFSCDVYEDSFSKF